MDRRNPPGGKTPPLPSGREEAGESEKAAPLPPEVGGRGGAEPTRYGDWEVNGICTDF